MQRFVTSIRKGTGPDGAGRAAGTRSMARSTDAAAAFSDQRSGAQLQAQAMADDSPGLAAQRRLQAVVDDSPLLQDQPLRGAGSSNTAGTQESNRTGLPDGLKAGIEAHSGLSLDDVRVHQNSARPAGLGASAYTQGNEIHLGPGQERHLPHEAWHVVQQKQGRVKPTMEMKGAQINDDPHLEAEADAMGARAAKGNPSA